MIIGHQRILEFLERSVKKQRMAHAYLFTGPAHLGKQTVALEFIRMLVGKEMDKAVHPDVLIVKPEVVETDKGVKKELEIGIKQAREIQHQMSLFPYQADYKIVLIDKVDQLTNEAANCLLKTLEEPSGKAVLILVTANPQILLPTIISRCQMVNFLPVAEKEIKKGINVILSQQTKNLVTAVTSTGSFTNAQDDNLDRVIRLANGRPGLVIQYLENPELLEKQDKIINQLEKLLRTNLSERYQYVEEMAKDGPVARQILNTWIFWFRDLFLLANNCSDLTLYPETDKYKGCYSSFKLKKIIEAIKKTDQLLANPSINSRLALEVLMLEI